MTRAEIDLLFAPVLNRADAAIEKNRRGADWDDYWLGRKVEDATKRLGDFRKWRNGDA
jgi:hypothetical protein